MVSFIGPDVAQVAYKPVITIADSTKFDDGVSLKIAGSNGATELTADEVVSVYVYVRDFLKAKGLDPDLVSQANRLLDQSYISN